MSKKSSSENQDNSYRCDSDTLKHNQNKNEVQNEIIGGRVNLDKEFDKLYERMTQTSASFEAEEKTLNEIKGYEKIETRDCLQSIAQNQDSQNSFQKSTEEIALEKDVEDAVRMHIKTNGNSHLSSCNMTDAEKYKTKVGSNHQESNSTKFGINQTDHLVQLNLGTTLPPLEDPSVILTSPKYSRKKQEVIPNQADVDVEKNIISYQQKEKTHCYDTSDYAESSLTEEVHKVQEDRARSFLQDFIHGKNSQEHQSPQPPDHVANEDKLNPTYAINSHFNELKMKQQEEQKHFHKKLMQELCTSASRMKASTTVVNSGNN